MDFGEVSQRVAFGPGVAAGAGEGQGLVEFVSGAFDLLPFRLRRVGAGAVQADSAAQHQRVGLIGQHPARRGKAQRRLDRRQRLVKAALAALQLGAGQQNARKVPDLMRAVEDRPSMGQVLRSLRPTSRLRGENAEQVVAACDVVLPTIALADSQIGLGDRAGAVGLPQADQQCGPPDATPGIEFVTVRVFARSMVLAASNAARASPLLPWPASASAR